jgi:trigger factor
VKTVAESLSPTRVRLNVEVPFEELQPSIDAAYRKIAGQVNVPGFRRGKVPPKIIDQRFGRGVVLQEAIDDALTPRRSKKPTLLRWPIPRSRSPN